MDESEGNLDALGRPIPTEDLFVKDAFLVFRALCKLSMKPLVTERYFYPREGSELTVSVSATSGPTQCGRSCYLSIWSSPSLNLMQTCSPTPLSPFRRTLPSR